MVCTARCREIYRYTGAEAIFTGAELSIRLTVCCPKLTYQFAGDYVYTYNCDEHLPLSFFHRLLPCVTRLRGRPLRGVCMRRWRVLPRRTGWIATRTRLRAVNLFHLGGKFDFKWHNTPIEVTLTARNVPGQEVFQSPEFLPQSGDSRTGQELTGFNQNSI